MYRNGLRRIGLAGALVALLTLTAWAEDAVYHFYLRKDLELLVENEPDKIVGQQVVFTDELTVIWPEVAERPNEVDDERYVLFDTTDFHCAVPEEKLETHLQSIADDARRGYGDITKEIEDINEQERTRKISTSQATEARRNLYWKLFRVWKNKPIVTVYGTVRRADFWGDVKGKSQGVGTERVSIIVDKLEKPRRRWYLNLDE